MQRERERTDNAVGFIRPRPSSWAPPLDRSSAPLGGEEREEALFFRCGADCDAILCKAGALSQAFSKAILKFAVASAKRVRKGQAQARVQPAFHPLPATKSPSLPPLPPPSIPHIPARLVEERLVVSLEALGVGLQPVLQPLSPLQGKQRLKELLIEVSLFSSRLSRVLLLSSPLLSAGARAGLKRSTPRPSPQPCPPGPTTKGPRFPQLFLPAWTDVAGVHPDLQVQRAVLRPHLTSHVANPSLHRHPLTR